MELEGLSLCLDDQVCRRGVLSAQQRRNMCGQRLKGARRLCVVVREEEVSYAVVEGVVQAALALEGIAFAEGAVLKQQADDFIVATEASLVEEGLLLWTGASLIAARTQHLPESAECNRTCLAH